MAVAAISQLRRNVGFMFRETGQALDRLGMSVMADYAYKEPREFSLSLMMACPRAAGAAARRAGRGAIRAERAGVGRGLGIRAEGSTSAGAMQPASPAPAGCFAVRSLSPYRAQLMPPTFCRSESAPECDGGV